jgi:hypothetical protein
MPERMVALTLLAAATVEPLQRRPHRLLDARRYLISRMAA